MTISLLFRRHDGTFVADIGGIPYHVVPSDESYWAAAHDEADRLGSALPYEPDPPQPEPPSSPRLTAMWRARAIARVTAHGSGSLFDAVEAAINGISDPVMAAAAREAWDRGTTFDLDGQVVPALMATLGISEAEILPLIAAAETLPA